MYSVIILTHRNKKKEVKNGKAIFKHNGLSYSYSIHFFISSDIFSKTRYNLLINDDFSTYFCTNN